MTVTLDPFQTWERLRIADASYLSPVLQVLPAYDRLGLNIVSASHLAELEDRCRIGMMVVKGEIGLQRDFSKKIEETVPDTIVRHHSVIG